MTITAGAQVNYLFSCNGLFDPNVTGTGHQPLYFDQLMAIYDHYVVLNSKCTIVTGGKGTSNGQLIALGIDDDGSPSASSLLPERAGYVFKNLNDNSQPQTLNLAWRANVTFGVNPGDNDNLQGTSTANPAEVATYVLSLQNLAAPDSVTIYVNVTIDYYTEFFELASIAQS
jgi:hypothetical protein